MFNSPGEYYGSGGSLIKEELTDNQTSNWKIDIQTAVKNFFNNQVGNAVGTLSFLDEDRDYGRVWRCGAGDVPGYGIYFGHRYCWYTPAVGEEDLEHIHLGHELLRYEKLPAYPYDPSISWEYEDVPDGERVSGNPEAGPNYEVITMVPEDPVAVGYRRLNESVLWAMAYLIDKLQRTIKVLASSDECCTNPINSDTNFDRLTYYPELIIHLTKEQEQEHHPRTGQTIKDWWRSFEHSWQPVNISSEETGRNNKSNIDVSALRNEIAGKQIGVFIDSWISLGLPTRVVKTETGITSCEILTKDDIFTT
jgi:hypothetical protein